MRLAMAMQPILEATQPLPSAAAPPAGEAGIASAKPGRRLVWWGAGIVLAIVLAVGAVLVVRVVRRPPEVLVVGVRVEDISRMLAVTGRVDALQTVLVSPQFAGRITEIVRHEGERVTSGEVLARLADSSARSNLVQQQAALSSREHDRAQARRELARTVSLEGKGASTTLELEKARLVMSRATDDVRRLAAVLREGQAQLTLLAPFAGTIVRRDGELGQIVGPQTTVFEIATLDEARVSAEVDERYIRRLRLGMSAQILPVGSDEAGLAATVSYVAQSVDRQTGAGTVRFAYEHAPTQTLLGMSVDVNISIESVASAVTIPRESVGGDGTHPFVLIITNDRVSKRKVTIDDWPALRVVVRSGLQQGDRILVDPTGAAVGARVRAKVMPDAL
ncbi:MAG: efflux RND transporter periplasmic adaptor subunit [Myxococcales bacterium]|nr:efflux RND transporter periplasmic adaptor subunit [Myxococcales bacterium]